MRKILVSLAVCLAASQAQASTFKWGHDVSGTPDKGTGSRFASTSVSVSVPLERADRGTESLTSDVALELTEFRWEGANAAEGEYIWLSVPIHYRQKRRGSTEFHLMAEPGLMTDLDAVGTESLNLNVELSGRSYTGRTTFWQYGLIVNRYFGDRKPRPLLALATKLTNDTEIWLGFPKSNIQTRWSQTLSTYARFYPDGGYWKEEVDGVTPADVTTVSYTNWRMGVGAEFRWRPGVWLNAEIGQLRNRTIRATDSTGVEVSADPGENGYWQLGGSLRF
ncbi:MAG: hypothetical protein VYB48_01235 [Pseudomonadota bacterium]|nr:hypothetical protein [Pseudomonadota bacterium]MEC8103758.1 hypothetical protein [Pseudomonadota bacterium]